MTIYELHAEYPAKTYCNGLVFAKDESEAIDKFKSLFNLDAGVSIRIRSLEIRGTLII